MLDDSVERVAAAIRLGSEMAYPTWLERYDWVDEVARATAIGDWRTTSVLLHLAALQITEQADPSNILAKLERDELIISAWVLSGREEDDDLEWLDRLAARVGPMAEQYEHLSAYESYLGEGEGA